MIRRYISFLDGALADGMLWCVPKIESSLLVGINLEQYTVEKTISFAHLKKGYGARQLFHCDGIVYIIPTFGTMIIGYDIAHDQMMELCSDQDDRYNAGSVIYRNKIFLFPKNWYGIIWCYDIELHKLYEIAKIQDVFNVKTEITNMGIASTVTLVNDTVWRAVGGTNMIFSFRLDTYKAQIYEFDQDCSICEVVYAKGNFWLLDKRNILLRWNPQTKDIRQSASFDSFDVRYTHLIPTEDDIFIIPFENCRIFKCNQDTLQIDQLQINLSKKDRYKNGVLTYGFGHYKSKYYFYPNECTSFIEYDSADDTVALHSVRMPPESYSFIDDIFIRETPADGLKWYLQLLGQILEHQSEKEDQQKENGKLIWDYLTEHKVGE